MVLILPVFLTVLLVFTSIALSFGLLIQTGRFRWLLLAPVTVLVLFFPIVFERAFLLANGLVWRQGFDGQWVGLSRAGAAATGLQHQPPFKAKVFDGEDEINISFLVSGPAEWPQNSWDDCPSRTTLFGMIESLPSPDQGCFRAAGDEEKFYHDADSLVRCGWTKQGAPWEKQTEVRVCAGDFLERSIAVTVFFPEIDLVHWHEIERKIRAIVRKAFVVGESPRQN